MEGKKTFLLPIDLTDYGRYDALRSALEEKQPDVVWLFNNAGFGKLGDYGEIDPRDHYDIANLNCAALSAVTGTVLPYMHAGAHIVNVCSIAAFAPTPRMTVYCSTKAFVYSFSKALRAELRKKQIGVTAVCPGPMDTEFLPVAGIQGNSKMFNTLPRCNVAEVAEKTVKAARPQPRHLYEQAHLQAVPRARQAAAARADRAVFRVLTEGVERMKPLLFSVSRKGYDRDEVNAFLAELDENSRAAEESRDREIKRLSGENDVLRSRAEALESELRALGNENGALREQVGELERKLAEAEAAQKAAEAAPAAGEGKAAAPKKRVRPRRPVPDGKSVIGAFRRMFDNEHEV